MLPAWVLKLAAWFIQLLAGPAAAREAGKQDATITQLQESNRIKDEQLEIAAKSRPGRDAILQRMRDGKL